MKDTDYGFIGVGRMGAHMARRLLKAGHSLTVFDTSRDALREMEQAGAQVAASALAVADATETAFLSLPTPDIVQKVCAGLVDTKRLKVVADCSTTGPQVARIAQAELAQHGIVYMDVPVSGGMAGARDGTLAVMVSGQRAVFEKLESVLKNFGKVFFVGEGAGQAQVMKLANNLLAAAVIVLSSEAIAMGVKAGLNPRQMCDIINAGSGRNSATQDKFPRSVSAGNVRLRIRDRSFLQRRSLVPAGSRRARRTDDRGRGRVPDARRHEGAVRRGFGLHLDRTRLRGVGRRRDARLSAWPSRTTAPSEATRRSPSGWATRSPRALGPT